MRRLLIAAGLAASVAACTLGTTLDRFAPAHAAGGARVTITLRQATIGGELLAVEDTAVFLATRLPEVPGSGAMTPLVRVPLRSIRTITGGRTVNGKWTDADRARFRILSRYPDGVSADLERRLLEAYGTTSVEWIR